MWNESIWNEGIWNESGDALPPPFIPPGIVTTPDAGVSFTISDELGGEDEVISDECNLC